MLIGTSSASLERVTTETLRRRVAVAVHALGGHEQAAVRALESFVPRAFGEQLAGKRLLAVRTDDFLLLPCLLAHVTKLAVQPLRQAANVSPGVDTSRFLDHSESSISAAMRLDPNTHAYVMATAFMTSVCFAIAAMSVIGLAIHLFVPGAG